MTQAYTCSCIRLLTACKLCAGAPSLMTGAADPNPHTSPHDVPKINAAAQTSPSGAPFRPDGWAGFPSPHPSRGGLSCERSRPISVSSLKAHCQTQTEDKMSVPERHESPGRPSSPTGSVRDHSTAHGLDEARHRTITSGRSRSQSPPSSPSLSPASHLEQQEAGAKAGSARHPGEYHCNQCTTADDTSLVLIETGGNLLLPVAGGGYNH